MTIEAAPGDSSPGLPFNLAVYEARLALGMTQSQFARLIGVRTNTISRWETGSTRPGANLGERLTEIRIRLEALGVPVEPPMFHRHLARTARWPHGTAGVYARGCRCDECRAYQTQRTAAVYKANPGYRQRRRERKRDRYATDPVFREQVKASERARYAAKKNET